MYEGDMAGFNRKYWKYTLSSDALCDQILEKAGVKRHVII